MSKSIHITARNFKGFTKKEIDEQLSDPDSELRIWGKKCFIKNEVIKKRINKKNPYTT